MDLDGTYIGVKFRDYDAMELTQWARRHGVPNVMPPDDVHATVVFSRVPVFYQAQGKLDHPVIVDSSTFRANSFADDIGFRFESKYMRGRFAAAVRAGATSDFDRYRPHVTLSYDRAGYPPEKLPPYPHNIIIIEEYTKPLPLQRHETHGPDPVTASFMTRRFRSARKRFISDRRKRKKVRAAELCYMSYENIIPMADWLAPDDYVLVKAYLKPMKLTPEDVHLIQGTLMFEDFSGSTSERIKRVCRALSCTRAEIGYYVHRNAYKSSNDEE